MYAQSFQGGNTTTQWRQFAYITDNVASASKLQNTRKIFGQDFDGNSDVEGNLTASTGMLLADSFHYIDMGRNGFDRMNFSVYGGVFNFINSQNGSIVARLNSGGIDCNAATASRLSTARNIALSGPVTGNADFDGAGNIIINTNLQVGIGINQYYQDVKASRYSGVVYTNNTGNTITVIITASGSNNTALIHQVNGVQFINTNESLTRTVTYHVPNGASYMCTANIFYNWVELR